MSAYNCRAVLLLQKELAIVNKSDLWGIQVNILDDNIFTWKLILSGLKGSTFEGSQFEVLLLFSDEYNSEPPRITFQTIPVHPNVNREDGSVCLDCLDKWDKRYSVSYVILSLQNMLSEPSLNSPINAHAARLVAVSPNHYKQLALDSVFASQRNKSLTPTTPVNVSQPRDRITIPQDDKDEKKTSSSNRYQVSYESYLTEWKTLGTTLPTLENWIDSGHHIRLPSEDEGRVSDETFKEKLVSHSSFGTVEVNKKQSKLEQLKATRMQLLKDIRSNKRGGMDMSMVLPVSSDVDDDVDIDSTEVNSLMSWTENLPTD